MAQYILVHGKWKLLNSFIEYNDFLCSEYDVDYLLTKFSDFLCPDFVPDGQSCTTPLNPGAYGGQPLFEAVIPDIPDIIADLIGSGTYYAGAIITNPDGSEFTCTYLRIQVE